MTCKDTRDTKREPMRYTVLQTLIFQTITHVVGVRVVRPARVLARVVVGEASAAIPLPQRDRPRLAEVVAMARKRRGVRERREERQEAHERSDEGAACGREHIALLRSACRWRIRM